MIIAIFAIDEEGGMGLDGNMPWPSNKEDMKWFKTTTLNHVVVMGKNTWNSTGMPKPLPNRINVVFTNKNIGAKFSDVLACSGDVCKQLILLQQQFLDKNIFVIGGSDILLQAKPVIEKIFLTRIPGNYLCDVMLNMDQFLEGFKQTNKIEFKTCIVEEYQKNNLN